MLRLLVIHMRVSLWAGNHPTRQGRTGRGGGRREGWVTRCSGSRSGMRDLKARKEDEGGRLSWEASR